MPIDVASYLKFTPTDDTGSFAADTEGHVYYDDSQSQLKHYDGSDWLKVNTDVNYLRPGDGQYAVDSYTKLLIHSDTTNNSTTFTDSSSGTHAITRTGAVHSTTQSKIGATSIYFDGTDDYLSIADHDDWALGDTFTIDFWYRTTDDTVSNNPISQRSDGTPSEGFSMWSIETRPQVNKITATVYAGLDWSSSTDLKDITLAADTWYHIAMVSDSGTVQFYSNGVAADTTDDSMLIGNVPQELCVGAYRYTYPNPTGGTYFEGYMDEFRISKGIARWTSNFTVY